MAQEKKKSFLKIFGGNLRASDFFYLVKINEGFVFILKSFLAWHLAENFRHPPITVLYCDVKNHHTTHNLLICSGEELLAIEASAFQFPRMDSLL